VEEDQPKLEWPIVSNCTNWSNALELTHADPYESLVSTQVRLLQITVNLWPTNLICLSTLFEGERAVMNATVFHNGKHHVLATGGMNGLCVLYQMRLIAESASKTEVEPVANGNGHLPHHNGNLRKRPTHENAHGDSPTSNGHATNLNSSLNDRQHSDEQDYPELTFEINQMTSFQADFNQKSPDESFLKVVRFSSVARILVTGGSDGCLRIFGYPNLQPQATIAAHQQDVDDLDVDPSGTKIVSISKDGHAYIWNVKSRARLGELQLQPTSAAVSSAAPAVKYMFRACRFSAVEQDSSNVVLFTAVNPLVRSKPPSPSYICKWDSTRFGLLKTSAPVKDVFSSMAVRWVIADVFCS
jgi:prolactin regulatory element-binding protein